MRVLLAILVLFTLNGCAYFQPKPKPTHIAATKPKGTVQSTEKAYDQCISDQFDTLYNATTNPPALANQITVQCDPELAKIGDAFGRTLTSKVKHADPSATGNLYATAYEQKTRKMLIKKIADKRKNSA